jgi:hypothetical protein
VLRNVYAADQLEDEPLDPCGPYYVLLSQLWTSCNSGQVSEVDYEWFHTRTCTAMSEVVKVASAGASAAPAASAPSVVPTVVVPTAAPVAPGPGPLPVVCFSPSTVTFLLLLCLLYGLSLGPSSLLRHLIPHAQT